MIYRLFAAATLLLALQAPLWARCPIAGGATLVVRAPIGNLNVDTTAHDFADAAVSNNQIEPRWVCGKDRVELDAPALPQVPHGLIDWKIAVPRNVNLDLVTFGGSITVGDLDGNVMARTSGGPITLGDVKGRAAPVYTQGGFIKCGNVGDDAELRTTGGAITVGNVNGDAIFVTAVGTINAGMVSGKATAQASEDIVIKEVHGDLSVHSEAGNISVGDAGRTNAQSGGGSISIRKIRAPFQGRTESGDIRLENAAAWVEAYTGFGNIFVNLLPANYNSDLHVDLQTAVGDVTISLPPRLKATVDASIEHPAFNTQNFFSEFPMSSLAPNRQNPRSPAQAFTSPSNSQYVLNGGGNSIRLHTSLGKISIKKN